MDPTNTKPCQLEAYITHRELCKNTVQERFPQEFLAQLKHWQYRCRSEGRSVLSLPAVQEWIATASQYLCEPKFDAHFIELGEENNNFYKQQKS